MRPKASITLVQTGERTNYYLFPHVMRTFLLMAFGCMVLEWEVTFLTLFRNTEERNSLRTRILSEFAENLSTSLLFMHGCWLMKITLCKHIYVERWRGFCSYIGHWKYFCYCYMIIYLWLYTCWISGKVIMYYEI